MKSLAEAKRSLYCLPLIHVENRATGFSSYGRVVELKTTGFYVSFEISKEEYERLLQEGKSKRLYEQFLGPTSSGIVKYFREVFIKWQKASQIRLDVSEIYFLTYYDTLPNGRGVVAPYSNIPVGQPWLVIKWISR